MSDSGGYGGLGIPGIDGATEIGRSPAAVTYRATDSTSGRSVIVKVLQRDATPDVRARFEYDQGRIAELVDHANIVAVFRHGYTDTNHPYVVSEDVPGPSMAEKVGTGIDGPGVVMLGIRVAGALESAHRLQVVHGDLRPDDVHVNAADEPLVADFGIVTVTGYGPAQSDDPAQLAHAAPEQLDAQPPTPATDIYALGSTLYTLLAGEPAYMRPGDTSVIPVIKRITADAVPDLRPKGVPEPIADAIEKAMVKDPAGRWGSAEEFGRGLQQAQIALGLPITEMTILGPARTTDATQSMAPAGPPTLAMASAGGPPPGAAPPPGGPPGGPPPGGPAGAKKSKTPLLIGAGVVLALIIAGVVFLGGGGGDDNADRDNRDRTTTTADDTTTTTAVEETTTVPPETVPPGGGDVATVSDDTGLINLNVPIIYASVDGASIPGAFGLAEATPDVVAATDSNGFLSTFHTSGVEVTALDTQAVNQANEGVDVSDANVLLDARQSNAAGRGVSIQDACEVDGDRQEAVAGAGGLFVGLTQLFQTCDGTDDSVALFAGTNAEGTISIIVEIHIVEQADIDALDTVLNSIVVNGVP